MGIFLLGVPSQNLSQAPQLNPQQMEEIQQITTHLEQLQREIAESEMNLKAQEESIPLQKEVRCSYFYNLISLGRIW